MPIYEYECTNCHNQFDVLQKLNDAPVTQCPKCTQETTKRLVSAAAFQLKGSGWYVTDFKDNKANNTQSSQASSSVSATKNSSSDNTKSDAKSSVNAEKSTQTAATTPIASTSKSEKN